MGVFSLISERSVLQQGLQLEKWQIAVKVRKEDVWENKLCGKEVNWGCKNTSATFRRTSWRAQLWKAAAGQRWRWEFLPEITTMSPCQGCCRNLSVSKPLHGTQSPKSLKILYFLSRKHHSPRISLLLLCSPQGNVGRLEVCKAIKAR